MADDDYTLLSSNEVAELKQDVDYLKKNPLGGSKEGKSLLEGIEKLNENIEQLIEIFKEASDMMKAEERESDVIVKRIQPIERKMDELSDQNQKIAKGILAVADLVSSREEQRPQRPMMPPPMQKPSMSMQRPAMPQPQMQRPMMPPMQQSMLPPPPMPAKKKGLFGFNK